MATDFLRYSDGSSVNTWPSLNSEMAPRSTSRFWTVCSSCETVHACSRSREGHNYQCKTCKCWFVGSEVATISINDHVGKPLVQKSGETALKVMKAQLKRHGVNRSQRTIQTEVQSVSADKNSFRKMKGKFDKSEATFLFCSGEENQSISRNPITSVNTDRQARPELAKKDQTVEDPLNQRSRYKLKKRELLDTMSSEDNSFATIINAGSMAVQDSDFYDFDQNRTENSIEENHVWALYDDNDGMPRLYALIEKVISRQPFYVHMRWLEGLDNNERLYGWTNAAFARSVGEFKVGHRAITRYISVFSHRAYAVRMTGGALKILPQKGSVWALYEKWQSDWNESTPKEIIQKYEIVEIVTDFTDTLGGSVVPLVKLDGFKSLYRKVKRGSEGIRWVLRRELLRLSHQIPGRRLRGNEAENLPQGCWELDTAALPES